VSALLLAATALADDDPKRAPGVFSRTTTKEGIRMDVRMEPVADSNAAVFHAGDDVRIRLQLEEVTGGTPIRGANPAAWLDLAEEGDSVTPAGCIAKIKRFFEGSTLNHAELDLTSHLVVVMNDDATIAVVDPRFGYGDTRLIALIDLPSPGEDWVSDPSGDHLYVTLPASHQVAVIDTAAWKVSALVNAGIAPTRILLQPDGGYLWVTDDSAGVVALRASDLKIARTLVTSPGAHRMAVTANSSFLFVSNADAGSVSVIDTRKLVKVKDVPAGKSPGALAYSSLAQSLYVTSEPDGAVTVIGGRDFVPLVKIAVEPGIGNVRFEPSGRYALALNGQTDKLYVFDSSTNHLVQTARTERAPNQLAFSNKLVFIRHAGSDTVLMVPFDSLGQAGPIAAADFTGGNHAPGAMRRPAAADGIVQASSEDAVLVANPGDRAVYFYMEGMAAPMGSFSNFGKEPRGVAVVERNLRERKPGDYETVMRIPAAGTFDIAFFVDRPRVVQCIRFRAENAPGVPGEAEPPRAELLPPSAAEPGKPIEVRFRLSDPATGQPIKDVSDLLILMIGPGAVWQSRQLASPAGDGIYTARFSPSGEGIYTVFASAVREGLDVQQYGSIKVVE
jgi:YVTN family beta-propeller protein